jgi:hypothetical protein
MSGMSTDPQNAPTPTCFRCGKPAEVSAPRSEWIGSEPESQLPLCPDCLKVLTSDPTEFWKPLRRKLGGP